MRIHHFLAAALLAAAAAAPADAKTYCKIVREKPGDADHPAHAVPRGMTPFGPYDLKSMDVAADATHLTGVIRVADLANANPLAEHDGGVYTLYFSRDREHTWYFEATLGGGRDSFVLWRSPDPWLAPEDEGSQGSGVHTSAPPSVVTGAVRGIVDRRTNEIRMTVPLSAFGRGVLVKGRSLAWFGGNSASTKIQRDESEQPGWRYVFGQHEDAISAKRTESYPVGAPSCVRVGR